MDGNGKQDLVILLASQSGVGKSAFATAICDISCRDKMHRLTNGPTSINVDWRYIKSDDPESVGIHLTKIDFNTNRLYDALTVTVLTADNAYKQTCLYDFQTLHEIFGFENQTGYSRDMIEGCIQAIAREYIRQSEDNLELIIRLVQLESCREYIKGIEISVPLDCRLHDKVFEQVDLVLRDTCGWLSPYDYSEYVGASQPNRTAVDAAILFGFTTDYVSTHCWFSHSYQTIFKTVPAFCVVRSEDIEAFLNDLFSSKYSHIEITPDNVSSYLRELYLAPAELLEGMDGLYEHFYKVNQLLNELGDRYDLHRMCTARPNVCYVSSKYEYNAGTVHFDTTQYKIYEQTVFSNITHIVQTTCAYKEVCRKIFHESNIPGQLLVYLHSCIEKENIKPTPWNCEGDCNIRIEQFLKNKNQSLLGCRNGITTTNSDKKPKYIGTLFCATSTYDWLWKQVNEFALYIADIAEINISDTGVELSDFQYIAILRMCLRRKLLSNRDKDADYNNNPLVDRFIVEQGIENYRASMTIRSPQVQVSGITALTACCYEVARIIYTEKI